MTTRWVIRGADATTGVEIVRNIEAPTSDEASRIANEQGVMVSSVWPGQGAAGPPVPQAPRSPAHPRYGRTVSLGQSASGALRLFLWVFAAAMHFMAWAKITSSHGAYVGLFNNDNAIGYQANQIGEIRRMWDGSFEHVEGIILLPGSFLPAILATMLHKAGG